MRDILIKLALNKTLASVPVSDEELAHALQQTCADLYSECGEHCPVWYLNDGVPPRPDGGRYSCACFEDGKKMLEFIRSRGQDSPVTADERSGVRTVELPSGATARIKPVSEEDAKEWERALRSEPPEEEACTCRVCTRRRFGLRVSTEKDAGGRADKST